MVTKNISGFFLMSRTPELYNMQFFDGLSQLEQLSKHLFNIFHKKKSRNLNVKIDGPILSRPFLLFNHPVWFFVSNPAGVVILYKYKPIAGSKVMSVGGTGQEACMGALKYWSDGPS